MGDGAGGAILFAATRCLSRLAKVIRRLDPISSSPSNNTSLSFMVIGALIGPCALSLDLLGDDTEIEEANGGGGRGTDRVLVLKKASVLVRSLVTTCSSWFLLPSCCCCCCCC